MSSKHLEDEEFRSLRKLNKYLLIGLHTGNGSPSNLSPKRKEPGVDLDGRRDSKKEACPFSYRT